MVSAQRPQAVHRSLATVTWRSGGWIVEPGERDAAELNRALLEAGVDVRELRPETTGLPALFDALLDEHSEGPLPFQLR